MSSPGCQNIFEQVCVVVWQIDSNPQSALLRHRTQAWASGSQYGRAVLAVQSELDAHSTHAPVEALHAGAPASG